MAIDHTGADITIRAASKRRTETVRSEDAVQQLPSEEDARKNLRAVADRVEQLLGEYGPEAVFVVGEARSRSDFLGALPYQVQALAVELAVGARDSGHDADEVQQAINAHLLKRRLASIDDVAQRFTAEVGRRSGLAAEGLGPVCSGLRQGAVDTLIIGDIGEETVVADEDLTTVAPTAEVLSEQGAAPARTLRADEALPMFAVSVGAALVRTDERIAPADGLARCCVTRRLCTNRNGLRNLVVVLAQEFFGVVVGVGAGLAVVEVGWWDPFGFAVRRFCGWSSLVRQGGWGRRSG